MYNIVKTRYIWFIFSGILMLAAVIALSIWGLNLGIDFTGGTLMQVNFTEARPVASDVQDVLQPLGYGEIIVQPADETAINLKLRSLSNDERQVVLDNLGQNFGEVTELSFESIGPTIGQELKSKAIWAVVVALVAIIAYITYAFRKASSSALKSWVYGVGAIVALFHDILIVAGIFSVLGHYGGVEISALFVTALLTILGFSVHDTIVVYDRIRENLHRFGDRSFFEIINMSINDTLVRSLNTSLTTLFVLLVLYIFGGASISWFILALIMGIVLGTYSSIFIASPLLLIWHGYKNR